MFWQEQCSRRGPALMHAHWDRCVPDGVHPGTDERHAADECCHCGQTASGFSRQRDFDLREAGIAAIVDPDSLPLALAQPARCIPPHAASLKTLQTDGQWAKCPACGMHLEPKMALGSPVGPLWGMGRGWVSPRTKNRWKAIAYRAVRDDEKHLRPLV